MTDAVIAVSDLTRRFGAKTVLDSVTLQVPRGGVYGLVGANGAGKTTLIKHILGLLRAERGSVRVFGLDPVAGPVAVLSRIGYMSEENPLPGWMRVDELIRYSRAFYPRWARRNRCSATPTATPVAADVMRVQYAKCAENAGVVLYTIRGGGHQWFGGEPLPEWFVGPMNRNIDVTAEMWAFFRAHRRRS